MRLTKEVLVPNVSEGNVQGSPYTSGGVAGVEGRVYVGGCVGVSECEWVGGWVHVQGY